MQRRTTEIRDAGFTDHVLVCTNERQSEHAACADAGGQAVYDAIKDWLEERGVLWSQVHLAATSCLALCSADGTAVVVHPRGEWYSDVRPGDVPALLSDLFGAEATELGNGVL